MRIVDCVILFQALTLLYHLLQHGENKNIFRERALGMLTYRGQFTLSGLVHPLLACAVRIADIRELKSYSYFKKTGSLISDIR